jgi:acetylornithine deacetylase
MPPADTALDVIRRLIAFDTTSRNSNLDLIGYAEDICRKAGGRVRLTYDDTHKKANLFATIGPETDGGIVLSGHTDVVPVDGQEWSSDPFAAEIRDGKLYGRGSADMKGFVGTALALAEHFASLELKRPIHFALSYDEEVGCIGVRRLLDDLRNAGIKPALALIGEPTGMRVVGAHKAGAVIETIAHGREGHSSAPDRGANAVMMAGEFVALLAQYGKELRADRDTHFDPPYTTLQANMVSGGTAVNVLAREARVMWEYRALPDRNADALLAHVAEASERSILPHYLAPDARFETRVKARYPGLQGDPDSPALRLASHLTGANDWHAVSYGTEGGLFQQAGIPAVICGPGSIAQAHRADEYVALDQIEVCADFLMRAAQTVC